MPKRANIFFSALVTALISMLPAAAPAAEAVANYTPVFKPFHGKGGLKIAVRSFLRDGKERYLAVDPHSFETFIADAGEAVFSSDIKISEWKDTPYVKAVNRYTAPSNGFTNQGMTEGEDAPKGFFLTIDLCPSTKPLDKTLFSAAEAVGSPAEVAIAVSGLWIKRHEGELDWILEEERSGRLGVTWINHTFSHPYDKDKPLEENFLLTPGIDAEGEILSEEVFMLEHGLTPSPFFRFPGLVSDNGLLKTLNRLSLIPIGANAWMAKGEEPRQGSFILVHGNGNEPSGIQKLLSFFEARKSAFKAGELRLAPLGNAFSR